jgi:hypothetical protein
MHAPFFKFSNSLGIPVNDHDPERFRATQGIANARSHPTVPANDVVIFLPFDSSFQFTPPQYLSDPALHHKLQDAARKVEGKADPHEDQNDRKDASLRGNLLDFSIPHGTQGNDGHVKGIEKCPPLNQHVAHNTAEQDDDQNHTASDKFGYPIQCQPLFFSQNIKIFKNINRSFLWIVKPFSATRGHVALCRKLDYKVQS